MCLECDDKKMSRRNFLAFSTVAVAGITLQPCSFPQNEQKKALDDKKILHELVKFKNGADDIEGYLARPKKKGNFRGVLVLHGNAALPEDIRNTAAQMARLGFVGLAVSSTSREPDTSKISREFLMSDAYIKRYIADAQAGVEFLKTQPFFKLSDGLGIVGFCGGGSFCDDG